MRKIYTLNTLLEEVKSQTPKFEVGHFYEVQKSYYPDASVDSDMKNISIGKSKATLPLACSGKAKREFKKDKVIFFEFFKNITKGDFIEIVETDGLMAKCINRSIKEDILDEHYADESMRFINMTFEDILNGNVKRVYRGIKKYI